ncbi:MAG: SH3 domain-containing protein [Anaerolineales bacterium]|nr:SH3 domain-containing protein [Anaerolineales bacterium]
MRQSIRVAAAVVLISLALTACGQSDPVPPATVSDSAGAEQTDSVEMAGEVAEESVEPTETRSPTSTASPLPSPTITSTSTPVPPRISVSVNTNCRSGPGTNFAFLGVLGVGEQAEIAGRSEVPGYWYIVNPDDDQGYCWLWGEFAETDGDTASLPVYTPEPTPTPQVGFDVWFHGIANCSYGDVAIFAIRNAGAQRLWSGYVTVYEVGTGERLYGPARERHPFAESDPACPPGHGNELYPGEVLYIHTPLDPSPPGSSGYAEITLCSADHQGGDCVTKIGYFYIP